jgi:hypothetical protein
MFASGLVALPFYFVLGAIIWAFYGVIVYFIATKLFNAADTESNLGAFCRVIAFAGLPRLIQFASFNVPLALIFGALGVIWTFAATVIAIKVSLQLDTQRSAASAFLGAVVQVILIAITFAFV